MYYAHQHVHMHVSSAPVSVSMVRAAVTRCLRCLLYIYMWLVTRSSRQHADAGAGSRCVLAVETRG